MSISWEFHAASAFPQVSARWDQLNQAAGNLAFLDSRFIAPLLTHFGNGKQRIALANENGRLVAGGIIEPRGFAQWQSFQPSQMPLGPWLCTAGTNIEGVLASLIKSLPGFTLQLGITQLDPHLLPRPADSAQLSGLDYIQTAWVDIDTSFDAYWEARGKNLRTNMRKQRTKLEADGITVRFDCITDPAEVDACLAEYGRLEASGWKAEAGTAVGEANAQGRFYADMMKAFCASGQGKIWRLSFDDKIVAMDLCIETGSSLVVLKTAFDAEFRAVSPAFIMRQDAFKALFDEARITRIEFYGRLMEWHTRWTSNSRTLYHLNSWRWAFIPRLKQQLRRPAKPAEAATEGTPSEA